MLYFIEGEGRGGGASEGFVCSYYIYRCYNISALVLLDWEEGGACIIVAFMRGVQVVVAAWGF